MRFELDEEFAITERMFGVIPAGLYRFAKFVMAEKLAGRPCHFAAISNSQIYFTKDKVIGIHVYFEQSLEYKNLIPAPLAGYQRLYVYLQVHVKIGSHYLAN